MNVGEPFAVGDWTVDPTSGTLSGAAGQRRLTPKLTDLLVALARRAGQVVTRDELLREVWGDRSAVSDEPLTRAVAELRRILGDLRADPAYIETIPKRGYRMIASVRSAPPPAASPAAPASLTSSAPEGEVAVRSPAAAPADVGPLYAPPVPPPGVSPLYARLSPPVHVPIPRPEPSEAAAETALAAVAADAPGPVAQSLRARATFHSLWTAAVLMLAIGAIVAVALAIHGPSTASSVRAAGVAVLPFADLSPSADRQYFADGVNEEIVTRLAGISGLRVASQSAVAPYRHSAAPVPDVARRLGVESVIQGTVRYADQRVRVTAQLVDAATDTDLWAETFDRPLTLENLFDIQSEIADHVAAGLKRSLSVSDRPRAASLPTASLPAYEAFLLGKYHYRRDQPGDIQTSITQFQIAVENDAEFADAWDWLAFAWVDAGVELGWTTPARAFPRARAAALRALELNPRLATSSSLLGFLRATYDWDWQSGLGELERAAAAAPEETGTVWSYAFVLSLLGRHDEAIGLVRRLAATFPEDGRMKKEVAERLIDAGRFGEAAEAAKAALAAGAEPSQVHRLLGVAAFGDGDLPRAIAEFERDVTLRQRAPAALEDLATVYALAGRNEPARSLLSEVERRADAEQLNVVMLAHVYLALGDRGRALELLEQGADLRLRDAVTIGNDPFLAALRSEPRFAAVVVRTGLSWPATVRAD
jgi:TolB-like protein/DNA-binding winged helix-turn-helix (wHTH) protein/Tfp pilus assembly protein PilF